MTRIFSYFFREKEMEKKSPLLSMTVLYANSESQILLVRKALANTSEPNDLLTCPNVVHLFLVNRLQDRDLFCAHE